VIGARKNKTEREERMLQGGAWFKTEWPVKTSTEKGRLVKTSKRGEKASLGDICRDLQARGTARS
jgi:hypothetical protein